MTSTYARQALSIATSARRSAQHALRQVLPALRAFTARRGAHRESERGSVTLSGLLVGVLGSAIIATSLVGFYRAEVLPQIQQQGYGASTGLSHGLDCLAAQVPDPAGC